MATAQSQDKRCRLDLELFVLALIARGISTPYQLSREASLSPGATLPVLARLMEAGSIRRGAVGPRGRVEHTLTATGQRRLKGEWQDLLKASPASDIESVLRVAALSTMCAAPKKVVAAFLKDAAKARSADSKKRKQELLQAGPSIAGTGAEIYKQMLAQQTVVRLAAEAALLRKLAVSLPKLMQ